MQEHSDGGAGPLHKWTKPDTPWQPLAPPDAGVADLQIAVHPQVAAEGVLTTWEKVWKEECDHDAPWLQPPSSDEPELDPITPGQQAVQAADGARGRGLARAPVDHRRS